MPSDSTSSQARLRKATSRRPWVRVICTSLVVCKYVLICAGEKPAAVRLSERSAWNNEDRLAQSSPGTVGNDDFLHPDGTV